MKKSFQLSAIAIAISLTSAVYADRNISDINNVNVYVGDNNGTYGALNVYKGNASNPSTQLLVSVDDNWNGGTTINTNTTINGLLNASTIDLGSVVGAPLFTGTPPSTTPVLVQQFTAADGTTYFQVNDGLGNNATADTGSASNYTY